MATPKKPAKKSAPKKSAPAKKPAKKAPAKAPVKKPAKKVVKAPAKKVPAKKAPVKKPAKKAPLKKPVKAPAKKKKPTKAKAGAVQVNVQVTVDTKPVAAKPAAEQSTHITIVLDRSGSMSRISRDMEGGVEKFLADQRKLPGKCTVSLIRFDNEIETVFHNMPIANVERIRISPRGGTALHDATMKGIALAKTVTADKHILVVITDGEENSSKEYRKHHVVTAITDAQNRGWAAMFFGASLNSLQEAESMGFFKSSAVAYTTNTASVNSATNLLSVASAGYRSGTRTAGKLFEKEEQNQQR